MVETLGVLTLLFLTRTQEVGIFFALLLKSAKKCTKVQKNLSFLLILSTFLTLFCQVHQKLDHHFFGFFATFQVFYYFWHFLLEPVSKMNKT